MTIGVAVPAAEGGAAFVVGAGVEVAAASLASWRARLAECSVAGPQATAANATASVTATQPRLPVITG
jgi:hypothetical protein